MAASTGSKMICTICFEELKPIFEDLQAVSICGHVFHELCLQQWFEYCSSTRKHSCPICKQGCSGNKVCRLYFQSTGDIDDSILDGKLMDCAEDPDALRREVLRLEAKVSGLTSTTERQGKDLKELADELYQCKELGKREAALKDNAVNLLRIKSEELDRSNSECLRFRDKNMALAKELAAIKLVSDLDLDEDEVLNLASLGNESDSRHTIDTLRKSLVIQNKSYNKLLADHKGLISKCSALRRGEDRFRSKHEKAKEKISKLKIRIKELETAVEGKENELLRALKASKKKSSKRPDRNDVESPNLIKFHVEDQPAQIPAPMSSSETGVMAKTSRCLQTIEGCNSKKDSDAHRPSTLIAAHELEGPFILVDEDASELPAAEQSPKFNLNCQSSETAVVKDNGMLQSGLKKSSTNAKASSSEASSRPQPILGSGTGSNLTGCSTATIDDDALVDNASDRPVLTIRKEIPSEVPLYKPGDICFSGGFLGPDGTSRYLGKWCKRAQNKSLNATQSATNSNLIAVGSDGRGGRIKVLRSPIHYSLDDKENSAKRSRIGSKTTGLLSQGCRQIEQFFQKVNPN
ncbi:uncharacterized protein LOC116211301 [Punica granatum]|uniref:Uncharacterized protein LOC116211301 n=1 Tax=Punica granatum TaxID=22663 RepID=A0A6P8E1I7_PUNGR|nr:uncharacterized protein LOC116211301 [Punica granatum]XP_031401490.1 uncharacterized protein LOC116211301 [Punica granatum]XP_031401498.1 uncharacterized protein LOC116211301 [Punica granatum]XP_031401506.1 uncharacterized protein LOC116211301 [Punica granatum]